MSNGFRGVLLEIGEPDTVNTIGAIFVGWGVSATLFGIFLIQAWTYFQRYPNDRPYLKALVHAIWVFEAVHQAFVGHYCWEYTIKGYNSGGALFVRKTVWSLAGLVLLGGIVGTLVKIFFAFRVYRLGKGSYLWTALICGLAVAQLGTALSYAVKSLSINVVELVTLKGLGSASLALGAATDIITALIMSYYLNRMRTGFVRSETLINRLIGFAVRTGALTSAISLAVLVLYQIMPSNFIFISFYFLVCKLYSNSLMSTLNIRRAERGRESDFESGSHGGGQAVMMGSRIRFANNSAEEGKSQGHIRTLDIGVSREVSVMRDDDKDGKAVFSHALTPALEEGSVAY